MSKSQTRRTVLKKHSSGFVIGIIVSIVLGFGIVAGVWQGISAIKGLGYEPGVLRASKTGSDSATLAISVFPDSHVCHTDDSSPQIDWVSYCPTTSFEVPANSTITIVINQYDSSSTLVNDYYRQVQGTIGGVELVNNQPISQVDATNIAHTFTLQSPPDSSFPLFASVPLVGVPDDSTETVDVDGNTYPKPNIISFQIRTGPPGNYIWHCYDPCGSDRGAPYGFSGAMSTTGYMAGTFTVLNY
jgi:hypothetical protein